MKPITIFFPTGMVLGVLMFVGAHSQSLDWQTISSGGSSVQMPTGSLNTTTGQISTKYLQSPVARLTQGFQQPDLDLKLLPVFGPFCNGDTLHIPYTMTGYFGTGNTLVAELSDAAGDFTAPVTIATTITSSGGNLTAIIPYTVSPGSAYRIRLRSSQSPRTSNASSDNIINLCSVRLNLLALIEGYYDGSSTMTPVLFNNGLSPDPTATDSIQVELRNGTVPENVVQSISTVIHTDGTATCIFPASIYNGAYYVILRHRNSMEVWSKNPIIFTSAISTYDFTH